MSNIISKMVEKQMAVVIEQVKSTSTTLDEYKKTLRKMSDYNAFQMVIIGLQQKVSPLEQTSNICKHQTSNSLVCSK